MAKSSRVAPLPTAISRRVERLTREDSSILGAARGGTRSLAAKRINLHHGMTPPQKAKFDKLVTSLPEWLKEKPTKEERDYLERWNRLDLLSIVEKRDARRRDWGRHSSAATLVGRMR